MSHFNGDPNKILLIEEGTATQQDVGIVLDVNDPLNGWLVLRPSSTGAWRAVVDLKLYIDHIRMDQKFPHLERFKVGVNFTIREIMLACLDFAQMHGLTDKSTVGLMLNVLDDIKGGEIPSVLIEVRKDNKPGSKQ